MEKQDRRTMQQEYRERTVVGGVYAIKNKVNGKVLIESAQNLQAAVNKYEFSMKMDSCVNMKIQRDFAECGKEAFELEVLESIEKKDTQTDKEFASDVKLLEELWKERFDSATQY